MTCKEKQEVTKLNKDVSSERQVISNIQALYTSMVLISNDSWANKDVMKQQVQKSEDLLQSLGADDALKAMLATQMAAIHDLQQMEFLCANKAKNFQQKQSYINNVTKLSNVFIQQAALMQKLQGKGQQKITVEHVHVNNGGQAIIGSVETKTGGGGDGK